MRYEYFQWNRFENEPKANEIDRSEGFPERDIWPLGVILPGLSQIHRVLGTSPPPWSSGKCPNIKKCTLFPKWPFLKLPEIVTSRNKSPCGSFPPEVTFSELTARELIHFHNNLKNGGSPHFRDFGNVLPSNCDVLMKIKMVRMVHRRVSTTRNWEFVMEWRSYGQKLNF